MDNPPRGNTGRRKANINIRTLPRAKVGTEYIPNEIVRMTVSSLVPLLQPAMAPKIVPSITDRMRAVTTAIRSAVFWRR